MAQLKLYVTMEVSPDFFEDDQYKDNKEYIGDELQTLAEAFDGDLTDLEIK